MTKEVPDRIEACGQVYAFDFGFNPACDIEEAFSGRKIIDILAAATSGGFTELRALLRHSLRNESGNKPTDPEAGRIVDELGVKAIAERFVESFNGMVKPKSER